MHTPPSMSQAIKWQGSRLFPGCSRTALAPGGWTIRCSTIILLMMYSACHVQGTPLSHAELELVGRLWVASAIGSRRSTALDSESESASPKLSIVYTPWSGSSVASAASHAA